MTIDFNGSMLVKKIITDWKGPSRFRKWAKTKLYDRDRDWPVSTIGITGLRENFSRDRGIEESYWGPSYEWEFFTQNKSIHPSKMKTMKTGPWWKMLKTPFSFECISPQFIANLIFFFLHYNIGNRSSADHKQEVR